VWCSRRERGKRQVRSGTTGCENAANSMQSASFHRRADPGVAEAIVGLRYCHLRTKTGAERLKEVACSSQEEWCRFGDPKWRAVYLAFLTGVYSALGTICNPPHETLVTPVEAAWMSFLIADCRCLADVSRGTVDYSTRLTWAARSPYSMSGQETAAV
jgi:hypothetical protein